MNEYNVRPKKAAKVVIGKKIFTKNRPLKLNENQVNKYQSGLLSYTLIVPKKKKVEKLEPVLVEEEEDEELEHKEPKKNDEEPDENNVSDKDDIKDMFEKKTRGRPKNKK